MRTDISPGLQMGEASFTEVEIILSYTVMASVVDKLKPYARGPKQETYFGSVLKTVTTQFEELGLTIHMEPRDRWIRYLLKHVEVDPVMNSNILEITYKDKDPKSEEAEQLVEKADAADQASTSEKTKDKTKEKDQA